jgi:hypothetical protein
MSNRFFKAPFRLRAERLLHTAQFVRRLATSRSRVPRMTDMRIIQTDLSGIQRGGAHSFRDFKSLRFFIDTFDAERQRHCRINFESN